MPPKRGLGRGLDALIPETTVREGDEVKQIPVSDIAPNPFQPRKTIDEERLKELAESVRQHGILQPLILRKADKGYQLVAGERRWRAARIAGLREVPAVIRELTDSEMTELALIENVQREDLNVVEEALAYRQLIDGFGLTQQVLAGRIGKSRAQIANTLRILNLEEALLEEVRKGALSFGHAKVLLGISDPGSRMKLGREAAAKGWSVRELERVAARETTPRPKAEGRPRRDPGFYEFEERLREKFGTKVRIRGAERKGQIELEYSGREQLENLLEILLG